MNGHVDSNGHALVTVSIRPSNATTIRELPVWIDTGFNGDLVLPQQHIDDLALPHSGTVKAILADGSEVALKTYACLINLRKENCECQLPQVRNMCMRRS